MEVQVAVVGGGVMGLMTGCALARRGVDHVVLERFAVGHDRGSSHGATRIFRYLYDDPLYVAMAARTELMWRDFDGVLEMTGGVQIDEPSVLDRFRAAMEPWGVRTKLDAGKMWLDKMGVLSASRAIQLAKERVSVREHMPVESLEVRDDAVVIATPDGPLRVKRCVLAAGAWITNLVDLPVRVTREQVLYFEGDTSAMLPWVHGLGHWIYGIPRDGVVKVAEHTTGAETTADSRSFDLDEAGAERVCSYVREFLPHLDPTPTGFETCLYTNTADADFILDARGPVVVVSACSGHGFKFAPLIGEIGACLALDEPPPLDPRAMSRFESARFR